MSSKEMKRRTFLKGLTIGACAFLPSISVVPHITWAQTQPENLNALLEPIRATYWMPALAAAFGRGKDLVGLGAVGKRKADAPEPVQPNDIFRIGSCSKSFTSTLIAMLVEQGKLTWQSTMADIFPDFRDEMRPEYLKVTLVQLLSHRAGIIRDPTNAIMSQVGTGPMQEQRHRLAELLLMQAPVAAPGTSFNYANAGYHIAAAIVEQVWGQPWEDLMQQMIFKPLGMGTAGFGDPATYGIVDQPWGHKNGVPVYPPENYNYPYNHPDRPVRRPSGGVHCSLSDWALYASLHLLGDQGVEGLLLKPESFQALHRDWFNQNYALGWGVAQRNWANGRALNHTGQNAVSGWSAIIWIAPQRNATLLSAVNDSQGLQACDAAIAAMIKKYL